MRILPSLFKKVCHKLTSSARSNIVFDTPIVDAPEIEVEESVIHTSLGSEEELVCQVTALPLATVSWQKDGKSLDRSTPGLLIHQGHSRHSLAVLDITKDSEGQYECVATNSQGQTRMKIMLTGWRIFDILI